MTYLTLRAATVGASQPSLIGEDNNVADALERARNAQHLRGACCWVEREDGAIMGGTYPWTGNGAHERRAELLNVQRGFTKRPKPLDARKLESRFRCCACKCRDVVLRDGVPHCSGCGVLLYRQQNGCIVRHFNRLCCVCGKAATHPKPACEAHAVHVHVGVA